jgi:hypothetical protein
MRFYNILCAVGVAVALGGMLIFVYALTMNRPEYVFGVLRHRTDIAGVGIITTIVGAIVLACGILSRRSNASSSA